MEHSKACLVAMPFKKRISKSIKVSDFIFMLSFDLKWGSPEKVRVLLREAEGEGLVRIEGDMVYATAETDSIEIPLGFKPPMNEDFLDKCLMLVSSKTGMSRKEIIALVNERQDSFQKLIDMDALVLLLGREMGIDVRNLAAEAYQNLLESVKMRKAL